MKGISGRWILPFLAGLVLIAALNTASGYWVLKRLEAKAGAPFRAVFLPHLWRPAFTLKNSRLQWQKDFEVQSGTIEVRYDFGSLLSGQGWRTRIRGTDLKVRLSKALAESQGVEEVRIERVEADLAFSRTGPPEIFNFGIQSPELQFRLVKEDGL
ncbi:MAG: hypothetical protein HYU34_02525 [Candidatus Omnitrophica bacterium]|nr:hypothetical protein [Candidatus Omnitrophota bacterium]